MEREGHKVLTRLSVEENLRAARSLRWKELEANLHKTYESFPELVKRKTQLAGTLPGGQQQMVALGHALMSAPKYLVINEMSLGLAPLIVKHLFGIVSKPKAKVSGSFWSSNSLTSPLASLITQSSLGVA